MQTKLTINCRAGEGGKRVQRLGDDTKNVKTDEKRIRFFFFTVHLGPVLVNNHLDAQLFFRIYLFQISTFFVHPCAHHQENQLY
jgi:hypothetical protein